MWECMEVCIKSEGYTDDGYKKSALDSLMQRKNIREMLQSRCASWLAWFRYGCLFIKQKGDAV